MLVVNTEQLNPEEVLLGTDLLCDVGRYVLIGGNRCTVLSANLLTTYTHRFSNNVHKIGTPTSAIMNIELTTSKPVLSNSVSHYIRQPQKRVPVLEATMKKKIK